MIISEEIIQDDQEQSNQSQSVSIIKRLYVYIRLESKYTSKDQFH